MAFQYERLLGLCYNCGMLGHEVKGCNIVMRRRGEDSPYSEWLRAGVQKPKFYRSHQPPSPQRQNTTETTNGQQPSCEMNAHEIDNPVIDPDISSMDANVTESLLALITSNEEQRFPFPYTSGLHDNHNAPRMCIECNIKDPNPKNKGAHNRDNLIFVPISYVNVSSGEETNPSALLEPTCDCDMSRDFQKIGKTEEKKWKRRARGEQQGTTEKATTDGKGRRKKRPCTVDRESIDSGNAKRNKTMVTFSDCITVEAETQPH